MLVIDQFRADYVDLYGKHWTKGLNRLFTGGAVMTQAAFPYAATFTCAGHATIGTGAFPSRHGMSGNDFYDRALRRLLPCATDPFTRAIAFGGAAATERQSSRSLLIPTFADEMRRQMKIAPRVVSIAQKPRSTITLAGRGAPDTVAVWEEDAGTWATSAAYTTTPWPDVDEFVRSRPMTSDFGREWARLLPLSAYSGPDDGAGEGRPAPWSRTFPHVIASSKRVPDNEFVTAWERSPLNDEFLTDLAIHLLRTRRLGTGEGIDLLTLSLPSLDHTGHEYGPASHEVQDLLARLDVQVGRLLDELDRVAAGRYVIGMSSDHGVAWLPEQLVADGKDAGRISSTAIRNSVNGVLKDALGVEGAVGMVNELQVALVPGLYDALRSRDGIFDAIKKAIRAIDGVAEVFTADEIMNGAESSNRYLQAWRLSYVPGRSGEFMIVPRPHWILRSGSGTTHGSPHAYDQRVPLVFYGTGITRGRYDQPATPADLAPTLAALAGFAMPQAQGRALTIAIAR
jgi:predicted AlkP superfamily pyrophosphatase or phosphodiesterase